MLFMHFACRVDNCLAPITDQDRVRARESEQLKHLSNEQIAALTRIPYAVNIRVDRIVAVKECRCNGFGTNNESQWDDAINHTMPTSEQYPTPAECDIYLEGGQVITVIGTFNQVESYINEGMQAVGQAMNMARQQAAGQRLVVPNGPLPPSDLQNIPARRRR